jgi:hypothetical protein
MTAIGGLVVHGEPERQIGKAPERLFQAETQGGGGREGPDH